MSVPAIACTLNSGDLRDRFQRIAELGKYFLLSQRQEVVCLQLRYAPQAAEELRDVVALGRKCCAFLEFDLKESAEAVDLTITAPASASEFATALHRNQLEETIKRIVKPYRLLIIDLCAAHRYVESMASTSVQ